MGHAVKFPGANSILTAPPGAENVSDLHTFKNGVSCVSCWQLSDDELAEVQRTGRVFLSVMSGRTQPPVFVGSESAVRELEADYGVWRKEP